MNKVLFSPIGNTDPWRDYRDGAMLHIVRHHQPDKVVLFFTQSIWEGNEYMPGRKLFNWEEIIHHISRETTVDIKVEDIEYEHDFDSYKELFHEYITEIHNNDNEAQILLNVTSGTPQMESTLCLEYVTNPYNKQCIQVSTPAPVNNINRAFAKIESVEEDLVKLNENEISAPSRCKTIDIISFREAMLRSQLKGLIDHYDYEAALNIISQQQAFRNGELLERKLIELTDQIKTHEVFPELKQKYKDKDLQKALFHYLLLNMRYERQDVAETLIRVKSIAEFIIRHYIDVNWRGLIIERRGKPYLNSKDNLSFKLKYQQHLSKQSKRYDGTKTLGLPAYTDMLQTLEGRSRLFKMIQPVIEINSLRNSIAHKLESLTSNKEKSYNKIMLSVEAIRKMLEIVFPEIDRTDFNYFKEKNEEYIKLL